MTSLVLMENAGRGCADILCRLGIDGPVVVCCGKGNNGGDGLVIARHLDLRGFSCRVILCCDPTQLQGDALANYEIACRTKLAVIPWDEISQESMAHEIASASWRVDALLGTGATGEPRNPIGTVIKLLNETSGRTLAVDVPSGLDCETGAPAKQTVRATTTCTFVAPKSGFRSERAADYLGDVHVLDIGISPRICS